MKKLNRFRAKIAQIIAPKLAPKKPVTKPGVERFVCVSWMIPGIGPQIEIYDRKLKSDLDAWDENQRLYPCQIIGYAAQRDTFADVKE